ncbi:MAG: S1/P1 nuclease [Isosphaeraceae bacterium]
MTSFPRRSLCRVLVLGLVVTTATPPVLAWGPRGHRVATRIAEARLTPAARAAVRELLNEGDTLLTVCTWADTDGHDAVPGSGPWHYVNVPIDAPRYSDRHCRRGDCVVAKIHQFRKTLKNPSTPKRERARALLFLVHLVEDVHQPLHVGDRDDRGGNATQVQYFNSGTNLHRLWDSGLIEEISRNDLDWVDRIQPLLTRENVDKWSQGTVEDWADESLEAARLAYRELKDGGKYIPPGSRIGREYTEAALPILKLRMAQAGVRVANELNAIFAESPNRR